MDEVTEDALLAGRVRLLQPRTGYRAAIDPVLLASALPVKAGQTVLDAGCGVGAAALCLAARVPECRVVGLEVQPDLAELFARNITLNGVADRLQVLAGDLAALPQPFDRTAFDAVMTNPPFGAAGTGTPPPDSAKARAHVEDGLDLDGWIGACLRRLRPKGRLALIHRADRLDEILAALRRRVGAIVVFPLWPKAGRTAKRVLVIGQKGAATPLILAPGLVLHAEDGAYTPEADAILRHGAALGTTAGWPLS